MRISVDELDVFKLCGPTHLLQSGDIWSHPNSLSAAMACLVQAVYVLDKDRTMVKMSLPALAPDWYVPFRYKLVKTLQDDEAENNGTIVGAVFKWSRRLAPFYRPACAPKVVVAFRGTIPSIKSDLLADLDMVMLQLHTAPRFKVALKEVEQAVARYGHSKVCIAGHSLGAALCMLIGRSLVEKNCLIDAHLFNPPFPSVHHFLSLKSVASAVVASFLMSNGGETDRDRAHMSRGDQRRKFLTFSNGGGHHGLKQWVPHLYINTNDPVCADYVAFMEDIESLLNEGKLNGRNGRSYKGVRSVVQSWFGRETKPFHLIPSACLYVRGQHARRQGFMKSHGMKQWWSKEDLSSRRLAGFARSLTPT